MATTTSAGTWQRTLRRAVAALVDVLAPCRCLHCGTVEPGSMPLGLCGSCRPRLRRIESARRPACDLCGFRIEAAIPAGSRRCGPCLQKRVSLDRLFCAWRYEEPLAAVIHGLKFGDLTYLGKHIARELDAILPPHLEVDAVVPVPLHWRRAWSRGYNQAAEIARPLARRRGWRLEQVLRRRRPTRAQTGLDRGRRLANLRRAFVLSESRGGFPVARKRLLLIDDVCTTGATLEAAAHTLMGGAAAWVGAAVAGRTPAPGSAKNTPLQPLT